MLRKTTITLFLNFFSLIIVNIVIAETHVSGPIDADTKWTLSNGPYIVTDSVIVRSNITLTIDPGVIVKFSGGKAIQIDGKLVARGQKSNMITFTSKESVPSPGDWGYIFFSESSVDAVFDEQDNFQGGSIMEFCLVEYAGDEDIDQSGAIRMNDAHPFISNCTIRNNHSTGIFAWNLSDRLNIVNNTIEFNKGAGIDISAEEGAGWIYNNSICNNSSSGISANKGDVSIVKNIICFNRRYSGGGIYIWDSNVEIVENFIIDNIAANDLETNGYGGGIRVQTGKANIRNNIICGNQSVGEGGAISLNASANIESNQIYDNRADLKFVTSDAVILNMIFNVLLKGNTLTGNKSYSDKVKSGITIGGWTGANAAINYNNIFNNILTYDVWVEDPHDSEGIDAKYNWWGTAIESEIKDKIYDWLDDSSKKFLDYDPWDTTIRTDTPISPPTGLTVKQEAQKLILNWHDNPEGDTAGYKIYWGTASDFSYEYFDDAGKTTSYTINDLDAETYFVAVTAYDANFDEVNDDPATLINENQTSGYESWYARANNLAAMPTVISGTVSASIAGYEDLPVKEAVVILENTDYSTLTDSQGNFNLEGGYLQTGTYSLTITHPSFMPVRQEILISETGRNLRVEVPSMEIFLNGDVDGDGVIGLKEAIHALRVVCGIEQ
jgi:hypothetical protein